MLVLAVSWVDVGTDSLMCSNRLVWGRLGRFGGAALGVFKVRFAGSSRGGLVGASLQCTKRIVCALPGWVCWPGVRRSHDCLVGDGFNDLMGSDCWIDLGRCVMVSFIEIYRCIL